MRHVRTAIAVALLALTLAAPVRAGTTDHFSFEDVLVESYGCDVTITTRVQAEGTAHLTDQGEWVLTQLRYRYAGAAVDEATGASFSLKGRQIVLERPDAVALLAQGLFIRVAAHGAVLLDVGRLVFDPSDGSTRFASAHILPFDDPATAAQVEAAVCSLFD